MDKIKYLGHRIYDKTRDVAHTAVRETENYIQENSELDDDCFKTVPEIISDNGFPVEIHQVETEDGFILTIHQIPNPGRIPILLRHGFQVELEILPKNLSFFEI